MRRGGLWGGRPPTAQKIFPQTKHLPGATYYLSRIIFLVSAIEPVRRE
jgi:hypothetical protein